MLMGVKHYRELIVWQKAMDLVAVVYSATRLFPKEETWGLAQQVRRAAVSVPSNIAEGQGRETTKDLSKHLTIAQGSLQEVETQILIAEHYVTWRPTKPDFCTPSPATSDACSAA